MSFSFLKSFPTERVVKILLPTGGIIVAYNFRRICSYLCNQVKTSNPPAFNPPQFGPIDGALYLATLTATSKFHSLSIGDSLIYTLAVYGLISFLPKCDEDDAYVSNLVSDNYGTHVDL